MHIHTFENSLILKSLGWAIANSLWQAALLWIFYKIIVSLFKNSSPKFKNHLSTSLLFCCFSWFVFSFFSRIYLSQNNYELQEVDTLSAITLSAKSVSVAGSPYYVLILLEKFLPYFSLVYLLLIFFLSIKFINACRHINKIKRNSFCEAGELIEFAESLFHRLGIRKKIEIRCSDLIDVPATIGFLKPIILIPFASLNQLTAHQLEAILLHELSHIKRNDYLINLFISMIEIILFFNPFVFLLIKIIKKEREICCDDVVIENNYDRQSYASALFILEQSRQQHVPLTLTATSGKNQLLSRIKRIIESGNKTSGLNIGAKFLSVALSFTLFILLAWILPKKPYLVNHKNSNVSTLTIKKKIIETNASSPDTIILSNFKRKENIACSYEIKKILVENKNKEKCPDLMRDIHSPNLIANKQEHQISEDLVSYTPFPGGKFNIHLINERNIERQILEEINRNKDAALFFNKGKMRIEDIIKLLPPPPPPYENLEDIKQGHIENDIVIDSDLGRPFPDQFLPPPPPQEFRRKISITGKTIIINGRTIQQILRNAMPVEIKKLIKAELPETSFPGVEL